MRVVRVVAASLVVFFAASARATLPPTYTLAHGEIVADSGDERVRVKVECARALALVVRGSDVLVACGDELLTYTTAADVMRPVLVDRHAAACFDFDVNGACRAPYAPMSLEDEKAPAPSRVSSESYVVRRERRTGLGWGIIAASIGSALVFEADAWGLRAINAGCDVTRCDAGTAIVALDVAAVVAAIGGTIAGIAVAGTSHDVKKRTTMVVPTGLGLRITF